MPRGSGVLLAALLWALATVAPAGAEDGALPELLRRPAGAEDHVPPELLRRPIAPPIVSAPIGTMPNAGDQIQLQMYRDFLMTRQRQLEDRAGPQHPFAGIEALRNQQQLNRLNTIGPR
jgi:hypothetical protein